MKKDWIRQTGYIAGMTVVTAVLFLGGIKIRQQSLQQGIAEKILRFHVLAASDTKEDQELKLRCGMLSVFIWKRNLQML